MEETFFCRTQWLLGSQAMDQLIRSKVAVFGIGGVGGYVVEGLMRCGIGSFLLVDHDTVSLSNCNRQIIATLQTVGMPKVQAMKQRILSVNPSAQVETRQEFFSAENVDTFDFSQFDYLVDAIDSVTSKLLLIQQAKKQGVPILSSMGTGNKRDPSRLEVADLSQTSVCPLARVMRRELGRRGIRHVKVVYSKEPPQRAVPLEEGQRAPASISFVPSSAGLLIASEVVKDLLSHSEQEASDRKGVDEDAAIRL